MQNDHLKIGSIDEFGLTMAHRAAMQSRCYRKQVGCSIIRNENSECVCASCNWVPDCRTDCREVCARARGESRLEDYSDCPAVHAEISAIRKMYETIFFRNSMNVLKNGGVSVFITSPPCRECFRELNEIPSIKSITWERRSCDDHVPDPRRYEHRDGLNLKEYDLR